MKKIYFNLREVGNSECPNIGVIETAVDTENNYELSDDDLSDKLKKAIESHFDAEVINKLADVDVMQAYNACGVEFEVTIDNNGIEDNVKIEVEQNWLYS